jgi:hypothetical protein
MIPIAAIQLPRTRTPTRAHVLKARSMCTHQGGDQPSGYGDTRNEQMDGGVRPHGAPVFVAVTEPEHHSRA